LLPACSASELCTLPIQDDDGRSRAQRDSVTTGSDGDHVDATLPWDFLDAPSLFRREERQGSDSGELTIRTNTPLRARAEESLTRRRPRDVGVDAGIGARDERRGPNLMARFRI